MSQILLTVLELAGALLLVAALAVWAGAASVPLGLACAGVGLLAIRAGHGALRPRRRRTGSR